MWQYITLMKRIYLIDCPGVVPPSSTDTPQDILLKGVVRVENVEHPEQYIPAVLAKTKPQHIERTYALKGYKDHIEFLELLARKGGRLLHGGEPDVDGVAKMVLNDFLRGKIPWYTPPPLLEGQEEDGKKTGVEGRAGKLGEMSMGSLKRKRDNVVEASGPVLEADESMADAADDSFEGFDDEDAMSDISDDSIEDSDSEVDEEAGGVPVEESEDEDEEEQSAAAIEAQIKEALKASKKKPAAVKVPTPKKGTPNKRRKL